MKKYLLVGLSGIILIIAILGVVFFVAPAVAVVPDEAAVIVPPEKVAVIVPATSTNPGVPEVTFIGITTISPLNLAEDQDISHNVIVTFSEAMDPATVNQSTFIVKGPGNQNTFSVEGSDADNVKLKGTITPDATKKVWTFNPAVAFVSDSTYIVTVTTAAKGVSGDSLEKDFVWRFATWETLSSDPLFGFGADGEPSATGSGSTGSDSPSQTAEPGSTTQPDPETTPAVATITLTPTSANIAVGATQPLEVTLLDQFGSPIASDISYASSDSAVATVDATSGLVTAVAPGSAMITATSGDISVAIAITVQQTTVPIAAVNLGTAGDFVILSKSGVSTTGTTSVVGDIGTSPIDSTSITGFGLIIDPTTKFATSPMVTGKIYAADYTAPTPTKLTTAVSDMELAYTDAAGRTNPTATELGSGNIDGMTITPGLYKWGTGVAIPSGVTLSGGTNDVWIFQIAEDLTVGNGAIVTLSNGAQAKNIFWQVGGKATLGTTSDFKGNILSQTLIEMQTGAALNGRALAQTAITLDANPITISN